ncbi:MAG: sugar ABC transporter permease [Candidatus Atribacteria bacterium]|nr:sugar ABC transporter permease [Candidatus Atribacteria bacterium]
MRQGAATRLFPWLVLVPALVWFALFVAYPFGYSLVSSFYLWFVQNPAASKFVGLKNYFDIFHDPRFLTAIRNTFLYAGLKTGLVVFLGILLAKILFAIKFGGRMYMFSIFLPSLCSAVAIGLFFTYLYQPQFGLINLLLSKIGIDRQGFLNSPQQAIFCVIFTEIWQALGFSTLIFLTGLNTIPEVFYEAAQIDGASAFVTFWKIIFPLARRVFLFITAITAITAFQAFDLVFVMTLSGGGTGGASGGPGYSSYTMALQVYNDGMIRSATGSASAVAVILFIIVSILTVLQLKVLKPEWEY